MTNEEIKQQVKELKKAYKEADKIKTEYYEKQFSDAGLMPVYKYEKLTRKEKNALDKRFGTCYFTLANNKAGEVYNNDPEYIALKLNWQRAFGLFKALDSRYTPSI